eukprot:gene22028-24974_t
MFRHYDIPDKVTFELYFSLIYSLYALPNMFIPLVGGMMADRFGNKTILLIFSAFILIGSAIETIACFQRSMVTFLVGRFVFGCGAETLNVCVSILISKWFKGQELAFALAIIISLSKLATVVTDWTSPVMYRAIGIRGNAVFVTSVCLVCYLLTILLTHLDTDETDHTGLTDIESNKLVDIQYTNSNNPQIELTQSRPVEPQTGATNLGETDPLLANRTTSISISTNNVNNTTYKDVEINMKSHLSTIDPYNEQEAALPTYLGFSIPVWILLLFTLVMYGTFIPFTNWSTVIILQFYFNAKNQTAAYVAYSEITAARLQSVPNFISVFLTPVFGLSVDWFGHRTTLLFCSCVFLVVAHSVIYLGMLSSPVMPLVLIGVAFSIFGSVIWPCVPVLVEPNMQGTAYGIMTSFQNAGQFIVPLVLSQVYKASHSYVPCEGFFIVSSIIALGVSLLVWYLDEHLNHGTLRRVDYVSSVDQLVDENELNRMRTNSVGTKNGIAYAPYNGGRNSRSNSGNSRNSNGSYANEFGYGSVGSSKDTRSNNLFQSVSEKIRILIPTLPIGKAPPQAYSATSSLSSNGLAGSLEMMHELHLQNSSYGSHNNNGPANDLAVKYAYSNPHYSTEAPSPLLGSNKFSRLRAFSMGDSRPSVSKDLCSLASHNDSVRSYNSMLSKSNNSVCSAHSQDSQGSPASPIAVISIPNVVRKSQEYYERANSLQFPREDPHVLRRIISDRSRERHYAAQLYGYHYGGSSNNVYDSDNQTNNTSNNNITQSAPAYHGHHGQIMDDYQRYRMQQIHEHNMKAQYRQQEELVLVASPRSGRRSPRLI